MNRIFGVFLLLAAFATPTFAQLTVDTSPPYDNEQYLVQSVLMGNGVVATGITFTGAPEQIGYFDGTNSNIGLSSGVVMCTGGVTVALGPNNSGSASVQVNNTATDSDLVVLSGLNINDPAILDFDFVPSGDSIIFSYVFASEEYPDFVNSINDAFGFFLSGPGISGPFTNNAANIALIPGTTNPITINTVNDGFAAGCPDPLPGPCVNCQYYVNNCTGNTVQFDGFTTVLQARAAVQCGQSYHIKLAIGDASDFAWDSGVFLAAESFSSSDVQISLSFATGGLTSDSTVVEGCTSATLAITRTDTLLADTIEFTLGGSAINGVDYLALDSIVILAAGDSMAEFTITPILDTLNEGVDTLTISLYRVNECGDTIVQQVSLFIIDDYVIATVPVDTSVGCPGDSVPLLVNVSNYINPLTFAWSTGDTISSGDTLYVIPIDSIETYYVSIWDSCMNSFVMDSVQISLILDTPGVALVDTISDCPGSALTLQATGTGGSGNGFTYVWNTGSVSDTAIVYPSDSTWYFVTATDNCTGLSGTDSLLVTIVLTPPQLNMGPNTQIGCIAPTLLQVTALTGGLQGYSYQWSSGSTTDTAWVTPTATTTYTVTVTDLCSGLSSVGSQQVILIITPPVLTMSNDVSTTCPGDQAGLTATATGGAGGPYTYTWSTGQTTSNITVAPVLTTTYYVTATDNCGDILVTDSILVTVGNPAVILAFLNDTSIFCAGDQVTIEVTAAFGQPPFAYLWGNGSTANTLTIAPNATTVYPVTVTDFCNQTITVSSQVLVPVYPPISFSDENTDLLCAGNSATLTPVVSGGAGEPYVFEWSSGGTVLSADTFHTANPQVSTIYTVEVTDPCGTVASENYTIHVPQWDVVAVTSPYDTVTVCEGDTIHLGHAVTGGTGTYTVIWTPATASNGVVDPMNNYIYEPGESGFVTVSATDQCNETSLAYIWVELEDCTVRGVNVITPNSDGFNDYLTFPNLHRWENNQIVIYNRWGKKVYESDNYKDDWDGGNERPGTYYYVLTVSNGDIIPGYVSILGKR